MCEGVCGCSIKYCTNLDRAALLKVCEVRFGVGCIKVRRANLKFRGNNTLIVRRRIGRRFYECKVCESVAEGVGISDDREKVGRNM